MGKARVLNTNTTTTTRLHVDLEAQTGKSTSMTDDEQQPQPGKRWWTRREDDRVARQVDWLVIPIMFGCYTLSILDRNNLGNAKEQLVTSLGLSDTQWVWLLFGFHISYVCFHSLLLLLAIFPPSSFIALSLLVWGCAGLLQAAATSWTTLMVCRALLGMAESAFSTGAAYYFSLVFPRHAVGFRFAIFMAAGPFAGTWSGIFAWLILRIQAPIASWRILFLLESTLTILFVPVVWLRLPDSLASAKGLTVRERRIAVARLTKSRDVRVSSRSRSRGVGGGAGDDGEDEAGIALLAGDGRPAPPAPPQAPSLSIIHPVAHAHKRSTSISSISRPSKDIPSSSTTSTSTTQPLQIHTGLHAFTKWHTWLSALCVFSKNVALSSLPIYFPTILQGLGLSNLEAQVGTVPPYLVGVLCSLGAAFLGDRCGYRGLLGGGMSALAALGYLILARAQDTHVRYAACFLVTSGLYSFAPLLYFWMMSNHPDHSQRGVGLVILGTIGHCGPFLGSTLFPLSDGPTYARGLYTCAGFLLFASVLCAVGTVAMCRSNAARRRGERGWRMGRKTGGLVEGEGEGLSAGFAADGENEEDGEEDEEEKERDVRTRGEESPYFRWEL